MYPTFGYPISENTFLPLKTSICFYIVHVVEIVGHNVIVKAVDVLKAKKAKSYLYSFIVVNAYIDSIYLNWNRIIYCADCRKV